MRFMTLITAVALLVFPMASASEDKTLKLDVFKTETCGCCKRWIKHLEENDIVPEPTDLERSLLHDMKEAKGIKPEMRSCHTAVYQDKYVFEGHVPAKLIAQFIANPPEGAIGLSTPGMPVGSPGMEAGEHFQPYSVMQMNADGTSIVYAEIQNYKEQF